MEHSAGYDFRQYTERAFWEALNPELTIDGNDSRVPKETARLTEEDIAHQKKQFGKEGYILLREPLGIQVTHPLRRAVETLVANGCLPIFCFVYDEFWDLVPRMRTIIEPILESEFFIESNFWAFFVKNSDASQGFGVHRDYYSPLIHADGRPQALNLWIALTDAGPQNSCLYVLPVSSDPNYPQNLQRIEIPRCEHIRALPASAGSVVGFTPNIVHWGSRSSDLAAEARISIAIEVQSRDVEPILPPLWEVDSKPNFKQRLQLIGRQILLFKHHYKFTSAVVDFARRLSVTL